MIFDFHFLRPWWLVGLLPVLWIAFLQHRGTGQNSPWRRIVAAHLLPYLLEDKSPAENRRSRWLVLATGLLATISLAGPTFQREPSLFADDVAALVVVIKVTPSMMTEDIRPSRLTRSVFKASDLLVRRGGSKAALVAYAGTAHVVVPPTTDSEIIRVFASSLQPDIMPREGDAAGAALEAADHLLHRAGGGSILWIADEVAPDQLPLLAKWRGTSKTPVRILAPLEDTSTMDEPASATDAGVVALSSDDSDIVQLERAAHFASPALGDFGVRWQENGYWLTWPLVVLLLPCFRRGWIASRTVSL